MLSLVSLMTVALGAGLAKGVLTLVLRLVIERERSWPSAVRTVTVLGALIAFWFLAPAVVESPAASALISLLR